MNIGALETIRNILINYTVSNESIKAATDFGLVFLVIISSTVISAGAYFNIYDNIRKNSKDLSIEKINKPKSKRKKKGH